MASDPATKEIMQEIEEIPSCKHFVLKESQLLYSENRALCKLKKKLIFHAIRAFLVAHAYEIENSGIREPILQIFCEQNFPIM